MSNKDLINAQKFFKGIMSEEIDSYQKQFSLNLLKFDINDEDAKNITQLITQTTKLTTIKLRLSETLIDDKSFERLIRKISLKKQFNSVSFYIKYLDMKLLDIFCEILGRLNDKISSLQIQIKYHDKELSRLVTKKILEGLLKNKDSKFSSVDFRNLYIDNEENYNLLNEYIINHPSSTFYLTQNDFYKKNFNIDSSKINYLYLPYCGLNQINNLPILYLTLTGNNLSKKGIIKLTNLLNDSECTLQKLFLSSNYIGDEEVSILSKCFEKNQSLKKLDLSYNSILDKGIISLAKSLLNNTTLKKLILANNFIGNDGISTFCEILKNTPNDKFTKLDFSSNNYSDQGLISFSEFLKKHTTNQHLIITVKIGKDYQRKFLENCKSLNNLKVINFNQVDLFSENIQYLANIISNNKNLKTFIFTNNSKSSSESLNYLSKGFELNKNLEKIFLHQINLDDDSTEIIAKSLFNNINISEIYLGENKIGLKGVKALSEIVLTKASMRKLNLERNKIDHQAAYYIGKALEEATGLQYLNLNSNSISDEGCEYLSKGISKNETLIELNISNNKISNKGIMYISKELKNKVNFLKLNVSSNNITEIEEDFYKLFSWCENIRIADNELSEQGIIQLFHGSEDNRLFKKLRFKTNLKDDFKFKCKNPNLKVFDLAHNEINVSLIKNILNLPNLTQLILQSNSINDEDINNICKYINDSSAPLKKLLLQSNKIGPIGAQKISEMLKKNQTITELNLASNKIKDTGMNSLCETLSFDNNTLKILMVNFTELNDYCSDAIDFMLRNNKSLISLSIMGNNFTNHGLDKILSSLRINKTLLSLCIGDNKINDNAFNNLGKYLSFNKNLLNLEIKTSNMSEKTIENFYKKFIYNNTLICLNLIDNRISYDACSKLALTIYKNNCINQIKLMLNQPNKDERLELISGCPHLIFNS